MTRHGVSKTNAIRALDQHGVPYQTFTYDASIHSADAVAGILGVPASNVFKTLVVIADGVRHLLVMTSGDRELDLRQVAKAVGAKCAQMATQRDAERLTGLKVGGISPLALLGKRFEVYLDEPAMHLEAVFLNGGQRGINVSVAVQDLIAITGARIITATRPGAGQVVGDR